MSEATCSAIDPAVLPAAARLLVFDSGLGGLSVLREIVTRQPAAEITYIADDAGFPYGALSEAVLVDRVVTLMSDLIARHAPDLVVIACNTASTLVLPPLRARFSIPFVGTVPAIKPAAERSRSRLVSVLATPGTVARDYTRELVDRFAGRAEVTLVGSGALAGVAEAWLRGRPIDDAAIATEIAPCFREVDGRRTDTVVLGCTHYPLLLSHLQRLAPWPLDWVDGAPAIARRVDVLLGDRRGGPHAKAGRLYFTSGQNPPESLRVTVAGFGLLC